MSGPRWVERHPKLKALSQALGLTNGLSDETRAVRERMKQAVAENEEATDEIGLSHALAQCCEEDAKER